MPASDDESPGRPAPAASADPSRPGLAQRGLTIWARVAVGAFYRRVDTTGDPSSLHGRPAVIAVNHSNALGDIAVMLTVLPRFPRFLAASTWWRHPHARLLFRLGRVLPVDRRGGGSHPGGNGATFAACHDALAAGEHIAIFPEGELNSGAGLLPLRTGAARIALSAALDAGVRDVVIVPVAIVYEDRGRLASCAGVRFAEPIAIDDWTAAARADPVATAREVTAVLQERLAAAHDEVAALGRVCGAPAPDPRRLVAELALLAPIALAGAAANAPAVVPIALGARLVDHEGWQATTTAVAATVLLPLTWAAAGWRVARRRGTARSLLLVAASVGSGWVSLLWLGRRRDLAELRRRRAEPGANGSGERPSAPAPTSGTPAPGPTAPRPGPGQVGAEPPSAVPGASPAP